MMPAAIDIDLLDQIVPELEADGYDVFVRPVPPLLPQFLAGFTPDAIALRGDKNLVVVVMRPSPDASGKLDRLHSLLNGQTKWELRLVWIEPHSARAAPRVQNDATMRARIAEVRHLAKSGHPEPALLLAWATLEALGRAILTSRFERPQTPGRLLQVLASEGCLTPTEADQLRELSAKRNQLAHGDLQASITTADLDVFARVLDTLLEQIGTD